MRDKNITQQIQWFVLERKRGVSAPFFKKPVKLNEKSLISLSCVNYTTDLKKVN